MIDLPEKDSSQGMERVIHEHPFFAGLKEEYRALVAGCAKNVRFKAGEYMLREGDLAEEFYLIREGRVALEVYVPGRDAVTFKTLGPGEVVGVSWLIPPYRWTYDARVLEPVRAISLNAICLRDKCDTDHSLGYDMMARFVPILVSRLQATRLQLLDVYGDDG